MSLIEMSFAYEHAAGILESSCVMAESAGELENGWYDLDTAEVELDDEIAYLESRSLLRRHPDHPSWAIVQDEGDPIGEEAGAIYVYKTVFTPDEIQAAMDKNLAAGLRQLADALEAGAIDGKCIDCIGHGLGPKNDDRAHLMLRIDLAAPVRQTFPEGESREEFERDRMGQTGADNARKMFGEKEKS